MRTVAGGDEALHVIDLHGRGNSGVRRIVGVDGAATGALVSMALSSQWSLKHAGPVGEVLGSIEIVDIHRLGVAREEHDVATLVFGWLRRSGVGRMFERVRSPVVLQKWRDGGSDA